MHPAYYVEARQSKCRERGEDTLTRYEDEDEDEYELSSTEQANLEDFVFNNGKTKKNPFSQITVNLTALVLVILSIYALVITHSDNNGEAITNACGPEIWNLLLARMLAGIIIMVVLCCCLGAATMCNSAAIGMILGAFTFFGVTLTFMILEAIFATRAMQSSTCMTALDNANANGRMLPIMLYVFMSVDCLLLCFMLCVACAACGGILAARRS